eukprot:3565114-Pleurochrysis_carterae.AAC.1
MAFGVALLITTMLLLRRRKRWAAVSAGGCDCRRLSYTRTATRDHRKWEAVGAAEAAGDSDDEAVGLQLDADAAEAAHKQGAGAHAH